MSASTSVLPDAQRASAFLAHLWREGWPGALVISVADGDKFFPVDRLTSEWSSLSDVADRLVKEAETRNTYISCGAVSETVTTGRGTSDDIVAIPGFWLDLDCFDVDAHKGQDRDEAPGTIEAAVKKLDKLKLAPTLVVDSGHGVHCWWLFASPYEISDKSTRERATGALAGLQAVVRGFLTPWVVDSTQALAQVLRIPGTINRKVPGEPRLVQLLSGPGARYSLEELEGWITSTPQGQQRSTADIDRDVRRSAATGEKISVGQRTHHIVSRASSLNHSGLTEAAAVAGALAENDALCEPPLSEAKVKATVADVYKRYRSDHGKHEPIIVNGKPSKSIVAKPEVTVTSKARLGKEFWTARSVLTQIQRAAWSRQRSPEAVLGGVLARVAAGCDYRLKLPAIVGSSAPLCLFALAIAAPGTGKSTACAIATELLPFDPTWDVADQLPLGSGEGLAEVLFDLIEEVDPDTGKKAKVKRQVRENAFVYVDEGELLGKQGNRSGSTLLPVIRTIFTGGTIGQANASTDRKRIVPRGRYAYGIVAAMQPTKAAELLADADAGTPQRFLWLEATDPDIPDQPPPWPGSIRWRRPKPNRGSFVLDGHDNFLMSVTPNIEAEIRGADLSRARGRDTTDPLDAHAGLVRLKIAGLLAVLDGRSDINDEDWSLAGMVVARSNAVRSHVVAEVAADVKKVEAVVSKKQASRAVEVDVAVRQRRVIDAARGVATRVRDQPDGLSRADLRRTMRRWRDEFDDALDHAITESWVDVFEEPGQGQAKQTIKPGSRRLT